MDGAAHGLSANVGRDPVGDLLPQAESGIVTLSPVVQRTDVAERHDSGRSAVVSLLGDRSPAGLDHLEHRWIVQDLLGSLVGFLVPAGNHPHHSVVISGQPSFRGRSTTELFCVLAFHHSSESPEEVAIRFTSSSIAAWRRACSIWSQRRRTHEIRLLGGCLADGQTGEDSHSTIGV